MSVPQLKLIEEEKWTEAPGIFLHAKGGTNAALAERNYGEKCRTTNLIALVHGYHIWWCSAHHQPEQWCARARHKREALEFAATVVEEDGGKRGDAPKHTRWMTVRELATAFIKLVEETWHG